MNLLSAALIAIILLFSCAIAHLVTELEFFTLYGYLAGTDEVTSRLLRDGQFYVDRLYLKFPVSRVDVILGKQRIARGSGMIHRPTDTFNRPNPLSLSGRKEGINGRVNLERLKYEKFASRFTF